MRNLFALVGAGTIAFAGLGWYFGWYNLSRQPSAPGTQTIKVDLHPNKISTDVQKGAEHVGEMIEHLGDKNPTAPANDKAQEPQLPSVGQVQQLFAPAPVTGQNMPPNSPAGAILPVSAPGPQR
jgi:hypothetical protein